MKTLFAALLALLVSLPAQAEERFAEAELDQMLAPVALYPDALLSQVLMAATYPLDVVEAARWTRAHPGLQGDEAVTKVTDEPWDPSVQSLVAFPHLLQRMDEQLDWTRRLGAAFLGQEPEVMATVQRLRQRAQAAGHLLPDERLRVVTGGEVIVIEPADARVVYVPYYDPWVVYGAWGWPAHPPVVWAAWPGYTVARPGFWWGVGIGVTAGFFFGDFDWHHHHVKVVHVQNHYLRPHGRTYRPIQVGKWRHAPAPRRYLERQQVRSAPVRLAPQARPMPPALGASPQPRRIEVPRATAPRVDAPRVQAPRIQAPNPQARQIEAPRMQPPRVETPRIQAPRIQAPNPQARQIEAPRMQPPRVDAPRIQAPRIQAPNPQARQVEAPRMQPRPALVQPQARPSRAMPYDRGGARLGTPVDRPDRVGRVRADAAQHRPAQSHGDARNARRDAGAVPVRPAVRFGVAGDRPRMAR
jgi:hypothetical protein